MGTVDSGLRIIDVSDPTTRDTPDSASGIAIRGRYAYVADANGGLQVIDLLGE